MARLAPMLVAALPGLALGVLALEVLSKPVLQVAVGAAVVLAAGWQMRHRARSGRARGAGGRCAAAWAAGLTSGALTTSISVSGPPIVLWLEALGLRPAELRASLAASFLALNLAGGVVVVVAGGTGAVRLDVLAAAPRAVAGGPRAGHAGVPPPRGAALLAGGAGPGGLRRAGEPGGGGAVALRRLGCRASCVRRSVRSSRALECVWLSAHSASDTARDLSRAQDARTAPYDTAGAPGAIELAPRRPRCEHVFVSMVICVLYPRFELLAALGDRRALLSEPAALAPEAGREQVVGEVSAPAEAFGVVRGHAAGRGARALSGPPSRASRPRGLALAVGSRARPARGDRGGGGVGSLGGGLLRGAAARGHPRGPPRRGAGGRPPGARAGGALRGGAQPLRRPRRGAPGPAAPARAPAAAPPGERSWSRSGPRGSSSLRCRSRSCAPGQSCRRCRRSSSSSGSGRWASSPRFPRGRWPSGSGTRGCWRSTWPGAATRSSSRGGRPSRSASGSTCPRPPPASSSSVPWSCSWPGCSPGASDGGARSGGSPCPRASWPEAPGGWR